MPIVSATIFSIIVVIGFFCGLGYIINAARYNKMKAEPTPKQTKTYKILSYVFLWGFLLLFLTPLFLALLPVFVVL